MTKEDFIKKWNVAFEDKEQELEFAKEMMNDLNNLVPDCELDIKKPLKLDDITIWPLDKDGDFEIEASKFVDFCYLKKDKAMKLANYILASVNK